MKSKYIKYIQLSRAFKPRALFLKKGIDSTLKRQIDLLIKKNYQHSDSHTVSKNQLDDFVLNEAYSNNTNTLNSNTKSGEDLYVTDEKFKTVKRSRENLTVSPKYLNVNPYESFQLDCIYNGPKYLIIKLVWFKNGAIITKDDPKSRFLILDYIQNNTSMCILKFLYAIPTDAGIYTCIATATNLNSNSYLNDSVKLIVNSGIYRLNV